jgi:hypothetical protein
MRLRALELTIALTSTVALGASAQGNLPDLAGTWQAETPEGVQRLVVRADSSLSFGEELVRWRLTADTVYLALGGDWVGYRYTVHGSTLTLSGGDLLDPLTLRRIGPATPRPEGTEIPPVPDRQPPGR